MELVTLTTYLMKRFGASNFAYAISSKDYPTKSPSEPSQCMFQVQQGLLSIITLGRALGLWSLILPTTTISLGGIVVNQTYTQGRSNKTQSP